MQDNTEPPAAQRWRALAVDAYVVAEGMTDQDAKRTMRQIALGYEHMAVQAGKRETSPGPVMSEAAPEPGSPSPQPVKHPSSPNHVGHVSRGDG
jgi:hypothetical protein